jgi:VanZ family protein
MSRRAVVWLPALVQMAVIFGASSIPNLSRLPGDIPDKVGHGIGYAILAALVLRAIAGADWAKVTPPTAAAAWTVAAIYGITDEFHQRFVPGRTSAFDDWRADAIGAAIVVLVAAVAAVGARLDSRARPDLGPARVSRDA